MERLLLETRDLCKSFKGHPAVSHVSLQVPEGCVYGLLGPNGAGKSTILKMLTGMMRPDSGEILFGGKAWSRENLRDMGALIETPPLYGNLSARENLLVRTKILGLSEERIEEVLFSVDLKDTGRKKARHFSLGMKQRLGIAAALIDSPRLLVLDEPANGLDPYGIQQLREMIRSFAQQGITVILSSHILSEVEQTADYIGILADGVLGFQGGMPKRGRLEETFMKTVGRGRKEAW
ncbi:lantibiotic protection ABC transporter ATP-binding protein [[Clostridium] hylemonae]|uniref:Lantibiotic protection ABC transporter, ATP-binding subunit n=1 Tax=[Clostridium] hylemonae DSM 15053 TaxID=553973 RepID=C0BZP9_9FIRM|nr:lantibiotic protection ABC transporter ATP-binding protein [[Clostridium] hylemonae]EEG74627.1 lantibiotic protection ABC transporter, ATP-binding subunit [[Clostridium] hylemonae DSM 15053]QEK18650.1 putative ABC transporter ATP-binding protein YxlF [[Clostridium] hylemonae DSM 15053]